MKKTLIIPVIALALFIGGCSSNNTKTAETTTEVVEEEHHHGEAKEVELDNGEKWEANAETTEGINKMLALVNDAKVNDNPDYTGLKANLDAEFMTVLEKCTMTGESHDQLHNYLLPLKAKFETLQATSDKHIIEDLDTYLLTYQNYFK